MYFKRYSQIKSIDLAELDKDLVANRQDECSAVLIENKRLKTHMAVVEDELIVAFSFLLNELFERAIPVDAYLAEILNALPLSDNAEIMEQFVRFRRANGVKLEEDAVFMKTKDITVYELKKYEFMKMESDILH